MSDDNSLIKALQLELEPPPSCVVCRHLADMSDEASAWLRRALASRGTIGREKIAKILTDSGYPTSQNQVARHRTKEHA